MMTTLVSREDEEDLEPQIFEDEGQRMNKSVEEAGGEVLVVSQFTLYGDTSKDVDHVCPGSIARSRGPLMLFL